MKMIDLFVTTYNRKCITERCLQILDRHVDRKRVDLNIHDDGSSEYDEEWLKTFSPNSISFSNHIGIDRIMFSRIAQFCENDEYEYFYSCDNDILHDPAFLDKALELYHKYETPVTLYNTKYHHKSKIDENKEIYVLRSFPGASIFFSKKDISTINPDMLRVMTNSGWDWIFGHMLKDKFICPKISYCDHYPDGGIHATDDDIAENPTDFLKDERINYKESTKNL
jgi:hypothetical protein